MPTPLRLVISTPGNALRMEYTETSTGDPPEIDHSSASSTAPVPIASLRPIRIVPMMNLGGPELRLRAPIYVTVEESDGHVVALSYDLELAEQGDSEFEALDNLRASILELFVTAKEIGDRLPAHIARKVSFLESLAL